MIDKIRQVFHEELEIEDIRKIATYEYEIDTKGYNYYYGGYKLPMGTFKLMFDYGLNNIRIMKSTDAKMVGLWDIEYVITIRFTVDVEKLEERLQEDEEWRELWNSTSSTES